MKLLRNILLALMLVVAQYATAATPPPAPPPVQYNNGTSNDTESYIAGNPSDQSMYDTLIALVYSSFNDVLDTFEAFFNKVIATVAGYSGYQVVRNTTSGPNGSIKGIVQFYDANDPANMLVAIEARSTGPNGTGNWTVLETVPGTFEIPPQSVPIDGGASLLLISGVAYGVARFRKRKQQAA